MAVYYTTVEQYIYNSRGNILTSVGSVVSDGSRSIVGASLFSIGSVVMESTQVTMSGVYFDSRVDFALNGASVINSVQNLSSAIDIALNSSSIIGFVSYDTRYLSVAYRPATSFIANNTTKHFIRSEV